MIVRLVPADIYHSAFPTPHNIFSSRVFTAITEGNAEAVRHFVGYDDDMKPRLGLIAGYRDGGWHAPYSAPFAAIDYNRLQHLEHIYDFVSELTNMLSAPLTISLPPTFYDEQMLPRVSGIMANYASRVYCDFDYYYPLVQADDYIAHLDRNARKNYNRAVSAGFVFAKTDDIDRAYAIIKANRDSHRYPLAMSLAQVKETVAQIPADFFVLSLGDEDVAAAMVYHVTDRVVQVIYWGDRPGYSEMRPMNILPYHIFTYYRAAGFDIVDIGPSSSMGVPNSGLCRFKESIGCKISLKPTFKF